MSNHYSVIPHFRELLTARRILKKMQRYTVYFIWKLLYVGKLRNQHYELLEHPPCFPDLAPSDFYLFPKLKLFVAGRRFSSNQEAIAAVEGYFADLTKNHYRDGIMALEHRWNKCISLKGDYVEK
jgi:hypothetical protein